MVRWDAMIYDGPISGARSPPPSLARPANIDRASRDWGFVEACLFVVVSPLLSCMLRSFFVRNLVSGNPPLLPKDVSPHPPISSFCLTPLFFRNRPPQPQPKPKIFAQTRGGLHCGPGLHPWAGPLRCGRQLPRGLVGHILLRRARLERGRG